MKLKRCRYPSLMLVIVAALLASCTAKQPSNIDNICDIFSEQRSWYKAANKSAKRWGTTVPVMMSVIYQESSFKAKAKPPRTKILWVFPGPRPASAKGYAQAIDGTWDTYRRSTGRWSADRADWHRLKATPKRLTAPGIPIAARRAAGLLIERTLRTRPILSVGISTNQRQRMGSKKRMRRTCICPTTKARGALRRGRTKANLG